MEFYNLLQLLSLTFRKIVPLHVKFTTMTLYHKIIRSIFCILMVLGLLMCGHFCLTGCTRTATADRGDSRTGTSASTDEQTYSDAIPDALQEGVYYVGKFDGKERIVIFNHLHKKNFSGVVYTINADATLQPKELSGKLKKKKCVFTLSGEKKVLHDISLTMKGDNFSGSCEEGDFSFRPYKAPAFVTVDKINRYKEECFEVETIRDVKYGNAKGYWVSRPETSNDYAKIISSGIAKTLSKKDFDLYMDLYLPKGDTMKHRPLVMFIHGGGFYIGDKRDNPIVLWCQHYAKMGYVAVSINYRMGFKPAKTSIERCGYCAVQDAHAAMRFLIHNKEKYRIDPDYLFVAGSSAGGVTTLNLAFMRNANRPESADGGLLTDALGDIESSGNSLKETFKIRCIANMWGAVHDIDMINNAKTSIISFHGDADRVVPYGAEVPFKDIKLHISNLFFNKMYGSKPIHERAKKLGYREELHIFKGCGHAPHVDDHNQPNEKFYFIQEKTTDFFYKEFGSEDVQIKAAGGQRFTLNTQEVQTCCWRITGGLILSSSGTSVRAVWLPDAKERKLECTGRLKNGAGFQTEFIPNIK